MKNSYNIFLVFTLTLMLVTVRASSQTGLDTAAILTGTPIRDLPAVEPVKPQPLESVNLPLKVSKKLPPKKSGIQISTNGVQPKEQIDYSDTMLSNTYLHSQLAYYRSIEKRNIANTITFDSVTSYYSWALKNRQNIITRQQNTGSIIFVLVIVLVLSGLIFSAIQFSIALKSAKKRLPVPATSFKASLSGVEVSSSVLGVIILTISIVFFYLYLTRVYPLVSLDQLPIQSVKY